MTIETSDDHFKYVDFEKDDEIVVARFEGPDRLEGKIEEFDKVKMSSEGLISLAQWILEIAKRRADDEAEDAYLRGRQVIDSIECGCGARTSLINLARKGEKPILFVGGASGDF